MVRRRTRATKTGPATTNGISAVVAATSNGTLLEDQYFASPKRKDCKMDNGATNEIFLPDCKNGTNKMVSKQPSEIIHKCNQDPNSLTAVVKSGPVGTPFTSGPQTKTIDNFFKIKTAGNNEASAVAADHTKTIRNCKELMLPSLNLSSVSYQQLIAMNGYKNDLVLSEQHEALQSNNVGYKHSDFVFELSEDTNDTDNTELSDETTAVSYASGGTADGNDFLTHRSSMRDSHSSSSSFATDNIFLQEPVLTLNVDKTPNQASSIKINRSLEIGHVFSTPPSQATIGLNGRFNQIVSLSVSPSKRDSFGFETKPDNDNSSCDSGVVFATSLDSNQSIPLVNICAASQARRHKPATPHRIVCPSPVKSCVISPHAAVTGNSPARRVASKEQMSPRKSPRHLPAIASKSRRRLTDQALACTTPPAGVNGNDDEEQIQEFESVLKSVNHTSGKSVSTHKCSSKNNGKATKSANGLKTQPPKIKQPAALPLNATNGNRELTEFFPVRRSVRKTKTAVKEEMMRNLEQAVLEERVEGLKVASFAGKGRGIVAERRFERGEFVVEYVGDLISTAEASEREKRYALDENAGCYMYYFKHKNQQYCIDATADTGKLGRLVNHSRNGNLITKVVVVKQCPHLILVAKDDIEPEEELTYDYGDRSKESLLHHPWLAF